MGSGADVITDTLETIHDALVRNRSGEVASYIPKLAQADPEEFAIALASVGGHSYQSGDVDATFTLQSASKPFVYALALTELGWSGVSPWLRTEPSGERFDGISLEPGTGRPMNPMINAGAMVATALIPGAGPEEKFAKILNTLSRFAGRPLEVDEEVFASEVATGDRNRALGYLMHAAGALPGEVNETADLYFRQCSVKATVGDVALMAATLAGGGTNPVTGEQVVPPRVATKVLAVMATCGMYNASGDWLVRVGLPAKSGVSGIVLAASPGRSGIAAFSPNLDSTGNTVRGIAALRMISERFRLHLMHNPATAGFPVTVVSEPGAEVGVVSAEGVLDFSVVERLISAFGEALPDPPGALVCDLSEIDEADQLAIQLVGASLKRLYGEGYRIAVIGNVLEEQEWPSFVTREAAVGWVVSELEAGA
ncbi:glutaminase A [Salininema proteolyticum]|uniref:Glutaminase n=1 Tax=Salininema proteolyticum TaxID=1607685 RepID=A0ABV8TXW2_9ACTN